MRISSAPKRKRRKKKYFKLAKGFYGSNSRQWKAVRERVEKALTHAYTGRKDRKGEYRTLWVTRINAACREEDLTYSRLIAGLKKAGIGLNRKMLAEMALRDAASFKKLVAICKKA